MSNYKWNVFNFDGKQYVQLFVEVGVMMDALDDRQADFKVTRINGLIENKNGIAISHMAHLVQQGVFKEASIIEDTEILKLNVKYLLGKYFT